ncbi:MAG TPA: hypothetical protein VHF88_01035, partial [Thermoleophilaceae bacterium]|nr:hypothetical protein [Thermoleophilaceae bacterium]
GTGGPAAPIAALTLAEARSAMRRGMRGRVGRRAKIGVRRCRQLSVVRVRCRVTARRGALAWKGSATVTERAAATGVSRTFAFRGKRTDAACLRHARASQSTGACVRRVRL